MSNEVLYTLLLEIIPYRTWLTFSIVTFLMPRDSHTKIPKGSEEFIIQEIDWVIKTLPSFNCIMIDFGEKK